MKARLAKYFNKSKMLYLYKRILIWRIRHIPETYFIIILSIVIGLVSGVIALFIKNAVHFIRQLLESGFSREIHNYYYFAYPVIGIFLAIFFRKFILRRHIGHGIPAVLHSISRKGAFLAPHNMFSSMVSSIFTVGFGGSVGLEGPTVVTGAAIGSNMGHFFHLKFKLKVVLVACATTAAIAAIFKAPIAAIVFSLEVLMLDLTMASLLPLLVASVTAVLTSYMLMGQEVIYPYHSLKGFLVEDWHFYILLAIFTGLLSVYFTKVYLLVTNAFKKIENRWRRLIVGGLALGVLIFLFPSLYGEGYEAINSILAGNYAYLFEKNIFFEGRFNMNLLFALMLAVTLLKILAASFTFGAGGIGGIFAPSLFMGINAGALFALLLNYTIGTELTVSNFAIVGMAGIIAGVMHAPLTGIFLVADLTGGYSLFIPLMIVSTGAYAINKLFHQNSVYTIQLASRGELLTHHADKNALSLLRTEKLIEKNFSKVNVNYTLRKLVEVVAESKRNIFPVVDEEGIFKGIVTLDDLRPIMFKTELWDTVTVKEVMYYPTVWVEITDPVEKVAQKIQDSGKYNVVVLKEGHYVGFVSRANVFSSYRRLLQKISQD